MILVPNKPTFVEIITTIQALRSQDKYSVLARALELELCDMIDDHLEKEKIPDAVDPIVTKWTRCVFQGIRNGRPDDGIMPFIFYEVASN